MLAQAASRTSERLPCSRASDVIVVSGLRRIGKTKQSPRRIVETGIKVACNSSPRGDEAAAQFR
jgi:hypothetical protein